MRSARRIVYECRRCDEKYVKPATNCIGGHECPKCGDFTDIWQHKKINQVWIHTGYKKFMFFKNLLKYETGYWVDESQPEKEVVHRIVASFMNAGLSIEDLEHVDWDEMTTVIKQYSVAGYLVS